MVSLNFKICMDRGYTGKFRIQEVPSYVDYEAQKVKRRKTRAPTEETEETLLNRRTHHNTKADDARGADQDVDGLHWSFNNDDEKHSKRARKICALTGTISALKCGQSSSVVQVSVLGFTSVGVVQELMPAT